MSQLTVAPALDRERGGGGARLELRLMLVVAVLTSLFVVS